MEQYRKGIDPAQDADHNEAERFGKVKLGKKYLFYRPILKTYFLPLSDIARAWRRVEQANSKVGCCSADFSMHSLMVVTGSGEQIEMKIGEAMYRHEPEQLMEALRRVCPEADFTVPGR